MPLTTGTRVDVIEMTTGPAAPVLRAAAATGALGLGLLAGLRGPNALSGARA